MRQGAAYDAGLSSFEAARFDRCDRQRIASETAMSTTAFEKGTPTARQPEPPRAQRIPKRDVVHGDERRDDYFWLRDKEDPAVAAYLEAENAYGDKAMGPSQALQ